VPSFLSSLSSVKSLVIVCILTACTILSGCGDNPDRAASKKSQAAVDAAISKYAATGDFAAAQKSLTQELGNAAGEDAVVLLAGSLKYGKACKAQTEFSSLWAGTNQSLDELSAMVSQITQTQSEKAEIEASLRSRQEERRQLGTQLDGDANAPGGLTAKLNDAQAKLAGLKSQQSELSKKFNDKLKEATAIQRQADELLAKAELSQGQVKADLQKQAYDLLRGAGGAAGKNAYLAEAQQLKDQLDTAESEISLIEPKAATFTAQIAKIKTRIDELDASDFVAKSNERLAAINSANTSLQEEFSGVLGQIKQTQEKLAEQTKQITDMFSAAQKDFKKITADESLRDFAKVAAAEALAGDARIRGDYAFSQRQLAARLTILCSAEATESQAELKTLAQQYFDESETHVAKAMADYNDASNLYGKIPAKKDDFAIAVLKKRIFALAQMAYLADRVENMDIKADAVKQAKGLIEKAVKFDPAFESSLSAPPYNLLTGEAPAEAAVEKKPTAPAEANEPNAATETTQQTAEPNLSLAEPNQPTIEPNLPVEEPNEAIAEPNEADANAVSPTP
jgi:predicted nuclease with TOPRIM domain